MENITAIFPHRENKIDKIDMQPQETEISSEPIMEISHFKLNCSTCSENYGEGRMPLTLQCGHSLCSQCAKEYLTLDEKLCPECYEKFLLEKGNSLPVNYALLRLSTSLENIKIDLNEIKKSTFSTLILSSNFNQSISKCGVHGNVLSHFCRSCNAWTCQDCLVLDHRNLPRGSCTLIDIKEGMNLIKNERKNTINKILSEIEGAKKAFDFDMGINDLCSKYCTDKRRSHLHLFEQFQSKIEFVNDNVNSVIQNVKEKVNKFTANDGMDESPEEITVNCKEVKECHTYLSNDISNVEDQKAPILRIMLDHFKLDLKMLVQGNKPVYAVTGDDQDQKWATICSKENRMLLYSLNKGMPPKDGINIPFEYVKKLIPNDWARVFFEVGTEDEEFGRVFVKLGMSMGMIQQVKLMCCGEKGVSYKGTHFYKYNKESGTLHGGDYENNDGSGGRPIVNGLGNDYPGSRYNNIAGSFMTNRVSTRFVFHLENKPLTVDNIGNVVHGLKVLQSIPILSNGKQAIVRDCGIFIPMKLFCEEE